MAQFSYICNFKQFQKAGLDLAPYEIYNEQTQGEEIRVLDGLPLTLGFRQVFSKVFDSIYRFAPDEGAKIMIEGVDFSLKDLYLLTSNNNKMDAVQDDDFFLVVFIESIASTDFKGAYQRHIADMQEPNVLSDFLGEHELQGMEVREKMILDLLYQACANSSFKTIEGRLFTDHPAISWIEVPEKIAETDRATLLVSMLFSFYYYGFVIANRFSRLQADISININNANFNETSQQFIDHRIILINMKRYFLTDNRSLSPDVKALCTLFVKEKFRLDTKYLRFIELLNSFEKLIESIVENRQIQSNKRMNISLAIVAFVGLPISIMGLLYQMSLKVEYIDQGLLPFLWNVQAPYIAVVSIVPIMIILIFIILFPKYTKSIFK